MKITVYRKINIRNAAFTLFLVYLPLRELVGFLVGRLFPDIFIEMFALALILILNIFCIFSNKEPITERKVCIMLIPFFVISFSYVFYPVNRFYIISYLPVICYALVGLFVSNISMNRNDYINALEVASVVIFIYWQIKIVLGNSVLEAGEDYSMGFGFSIVLPIMIFLFLAYKEEKIKYSILLIISMIELLIYGNKSPLGIVLIYLIILLFTKNKRNKRKKLFYSTIIIAVFINYKIIVNVLLQFLNTHGIQSRSLRYLATNRFFSLGSGRGTRSYIYASAIQEIKNIPVFGYGVKGDMYILNGVYPHNILLELVLQFGFVLSMGVIILFIWSILKVYMYRSEYIEIITIFLVYSLVSLSVSSSFWQSKEFWILVSLIWILPHKKTRSCHKNSLYASIICADSKGIIDGL